MTMRTKSAKEEKEITKQLLRDRVLTILSSTESGKRLGQSRLEKITNRVMKLFGDRVKALGSKKATVWATGEQRILHDLRKSK